MKEVFRHYGSSVIAVLVGSVLMGLIAGLPYSSLAGEYTVGNTTWGQAFESYWRCH